MMLAAAAARCLASGVITVSRSHYSNVCKRSLATLAQANASPVREETGPYNSVRLDISALPAASLTPDALSRQLQSSLPAWAVAGKTAAWLHLHMAQGAHIAAAREHGFAFHHAEGDSAALFKWLSPGPCKVPPYGTHQVGVAGVVRNPATGALLVVKEMRGSQWKFPGGLADAGEEFGATAEREVRR
jgi:hypothetical protein